MVELILADVQSAVVAEWQSFFKETPNVSIHHGSIFEVRCDALVSPANSFGFMDGGLDLWISHYFGWQVQERLQALIQRNHHGELLIGRAEIVPTDHEKIPYVIAAPTMRVPMMLGQETVNVYLATRAILLLVEHGIMEDGRPLKEVVQRIAIPGMGTGTGHVPPNICARQMKQAVDDYLHHGYQFPDSWREAKRRHQHLWADWWQDQKRDE
jgi:O-acetyl-ADP-ribose deacetylase (regulator of RNase III)